MCPVVQDPHFNLINKRHKHPSFWLKIVTHKINQSLISPLAHGPSEPGCSVCACIYMGIYLHACFHKTHQSAISLLACRLCEPSFSLYMCACVWVWVSIMTASQLSRMLKCQQRVQVLTCPHVLLSPVAAIGIKLSHIFRMRRGVKNRSARVFGSAVGWWLCTVIM